MTEQDLKKLDEGSKLIVETKLLKLQLEYLNNNTDPIINISGCNFSLKVPEFIIIPHVREYLKYKISISETKFKNL
jgi:hypothetical protein